MTSASVRAMLTPSQQGEASRLVDDGNVDILVVGGSITGVGVGVGVGVGLALDAAARSASLAPVEMPDFALPRGVLHERDPMLARIAPHVVTPVRFLHRLRLRLRARAFGCTQGWGDDLNRMAGAPSPFSVRASQGVHLPVPREAVDSDTGLALRMESVLTRISPDDRAVGRDARTERHEVRAALGRREGRRDDEQAHALRALTHPRHRASAPLRSSSMQVSR